MDMPPIHHCVFINHEHERLKSKINSLENQIRELQQRIPLSSHRSRSISCQTDFIPLKEKDDEMQRYEQFTVDYQRYKQQIDRARKRQISAEHRLNKCQKRFDRIQMFDRGFFDEVNDLKYALQQAIHLNREYEKTIQMLSAQLGLHYPIDDEK